MIQSQAAMSQNGTASVEKRKVHRQRVIKGGTLYFNKGYASYQCRVRNVSETGALLELAETTGLPNEFDFLLSDGGAAKQARMVWKNSKQVGISFQ